jgi:hypothetical protein
VAVEIVIAVAMEAIVELETGAIMTFVKRQVIAISLVVLMSGDHLALNLLAAMISVVGMVPRPYKAYLMVCLLIHPAQ